MTAEENGNKVQAASTGAAKRRRNRKKKNKNKNEDTAKEEERLRLLEESKMNPHARLRQDLLSRGFGVSEIDTAMEEMWNNNLPYDEFDAVLKYLETGGNEKTDTKEAATEKIEDPENVSNNDDNSKSNGVGNSSVQESLREEEKLESKEIPKPFVPLTMTSKLDMVAGYENLSDAIFALTEWVIKAAKPNELHDLCAAAKTSALPMVIQRSISECDSQSKFDTTIMPSMLRLMEGLLKKCGMSSSSIKANLDSFTSVLKQARRICLMNDIGSKGIADRVSRFIVSRILLMLNESMAPKLGENGIFSSENDSLTSSLKSEVDHGIAELLSRREVNKIASQRYCVAARSALSSENGSTSNSTTDRSEIFFAIVDDDTKNAIDQHASMFEALKAQAREGDSDNLEGLRAQFEDVQSRRQNIASRISELRDSLESLELEYAELGTKEERLQIQIDSACQAESDKASRLNSELEEASKQVKVDSYLQNLVDTLKTYDDTLSVQSVREVGKDSNGEEEDASKLMDLYLSRARNYYVSEANCVQFLRSRVTALTNEIIELNAEIEMCQGLGMATTINQMEYSVKSNKRRIKRDSLLLERISVEASSMFKALMECLEAYKTAQDAGGTSLLPIQANTIQDIPPCVTILGIPNGDKLDAFLAINDILSLQAPSPPKLTTENETAPVEQVVKKVAEEPPKSPKFTWANPGKSPKPTNKASLLDIQKEELELKASL